jgi:hypothetical protein
MTTAQLLAQAMVRAFGPYVRRRLAERGLPEPAGLDETLEAGAEWLRRGLEELLALPYERQPRGPLEVFQEAVKFPTESLRRAGVPEVERDPVSRNALPGDVYDLAPASSRDISDEVWMLHLRWGMEKAEALAVRFRRSER